MTKRIFTCGVLLWLAAMPASGQPRYVSLMIPMRDGKSLSADLFSIDTTVARPLIVIQTPYNKFFFRYTLGAPQGGGTVLPFDSLHYNYLTVDWRGFYESSYAFVPGYDGGLDGYDVIEWAAGHGWCNGKVGTWGVSALGLIQYETMKHRPPHLVCAMPMMKDYKTKYTDYYAGGVYKKEFTESLQKLGFFSAASILAHPTEDLYWTATAAATDYPESVAVPVLIVGGWFDLFPDDVLRSFEDLRTRSDPSVRAAHKLIVGPWLHANMENAAQGALSFPAGVGIASAAAQEFFDFYLRNVDNGYALRPAVRYYQMGDEQWREAASWIAVSTREDTLYFGWGGSSGRLGPVRMGGDIMGAAFSFDPRMPAPAIGGPRFNPFDASILTGPQDQRFLVESRSDVQTYTTTMLSSPMVIDGAATVILAVNSNRSDTDFIVRLCDVYPDGRSILMTQAARRMRFRNSLSVPDLVPPWTTVTVPIVLGNLALTIPAGHALRLDMSSSAYPQYDLNLNNGGPMYTAGDTLVAINVVDFRSYVLIPTVIPVSVASQRAEIPVAAELLQNYPNPCNPSTNIGFRVPGPGVGIVRGQSTSVNSLTMVNSQAGAGVAWVRLGVYDILGREVAVLVNERKEPGSYTVTWDAKGRASGVYIYRIRIHPLEAGAGRDGAGGPEDFIQARKIVLMK